jgi:hypothetical protein
MQTEIGITNKYVNNQETGRVNCQRETPCYNLGVEEVQNLLFVLQFALDVIENAGLGNTINCENWVLDSSLEEQIELLNSKL